MSAQRFVALASTGAAALDADHVVEDVALHIVRLAAPVGKELDVRATNERPCEPVNDILVDAIGGQKGFSTDRP